MLEAGTYLRSSSASHFQMTSLLPISGNVIALIKVYLPPSGFLHPVSSSPSTNLNLFHPAYPAYNFLIHRS